MRLLHVVPSYLPATRYGGPIYAVHGLCKALVARGHEVHVYTTPVDGDADSDVPTGQAVNLDGVEVWYFPVRFPRRLYYSPKLRAALQAQVGGFDFVHIHSLFLLPGLMAARACLNASVPYALAPRGMLVEELIRRRGSLRKRCWIRLFDARTIREAAFLHVTSKREEEEARRFSLCFPPVHVVANGTDLLQDDPAIQRANDLLLYVGRINWKKGLDRLIRALAQVPQARLVIAGNDDEGYWSRLATLAEELGVRQRIDYIGPVNAAIRTFWLRQATLFVLPSLSENFGNTVLEALAAACPVVVSPEVGLAEAIAISGAGVVCQGDPGALAAILRRLLSEPASLQEMSRRAPGMVARDFSWPVCAERMEHCYLQAITGTYTSSDSRRSSLRRR